jgi:hypothetical protein
MDPVSPVAQLTVAAISGAAFLVSMLVIPFPESKADPSAGIHSPQATIHSVDAAVSPAIK